MVGHLDLDILIRVGGHSVAITRYNDLINNWPKAVAWRILMIY